MPTVRKLPDTTTLRRLRNQGWTQKRIAETYGASESAVWKALQRAGYIEPQITYKEILPWDVAEAHKATAVMERFRSIVKQRKGTALRPEEEHLLHPLARGPGGQRAGRGLPPGGAGQFRQLQGRVLLRSENCG